MQLLLRLSRAPCNDLFKRFTLQTMAAARSNTATKAASGATAPNMTGERDTLQQFFHNLLQQKPGTQTGMIFKSTLRAINITLQQRSRRQLSSEHHHRHLLPWTALTAPTVRQAHLMANRRCDCAFYSLQPVVIAVLIFLHALSPNTLCASVAQQCRQDYREMSMSFRKSSHEKMYACAVRCHSVVLPISSFNNVMRSIRVKSPVLL